MRFLIGCEFSGRVRDALRSRGHDAVSCDLVPTETPGPHLVCDVLSVLDDGWDALIAFPPCTHLAASGARWFAEKRADGRQQAAIDFVLKLADAPVPHIAIENPISVLSSAWRKPDQIIQPWQYGHAETKATCLWLKELPPLHPTNIVTPDYMRNDDGSLKLDAKGRRYSRIHWMSRGRTPEARRRVRSLTYAGIAQAMAEQWGGYVEQTHAAGTVPAVSPNGSEEVREMRPTITRAQFAEAVGRTVRQVDHWIADGDVAVHRFKGRVSIPVAELDRVLRAMGKLGAQDTVDVASLGATPADKVKGGEHGKA
jgi:hypothetical protein